MYRDPIATANEWRARAEADKLSIRELIIEVTGRQSFIGTPATVAETINDVRPGRRQRRLHPGPAHHPWRPRRLRRHRRTAAAGTGRLPPRLRGHDPARPPGSGPARRAARGAERSPHEPRAAGGSRPRADLVGVDAPRRRCATASISPSHAERLGYARYWFAEHHLNPGVAGTSPAVVLALTAAATTHHPHRFRCGTARSPHRAFHRRGVRPYRRASPRPARPRARAVRRPPSPSPRQKPTPPASPARRRTGTRPTGCGSRRTFSLAGLFSSPGFAMQKKLLQLPEAQSQDYGEQIDDILALLRGNYRTADGVEAHVIPGRGCGSAGVDPRQQRRPECRGRRPQRPAVRGELSRESGHRAAGAHGYREAFQPSRTSTALRQRLRRRRRRGRRGQRAGTGVRLRPVGPQHPSGEGAIPFPAPGGTRVTSGATRIGIWSPTASKPSSPAPPKQVADQLEQLQEATGADELIVTTITHDHADRVRSYELLAKEWSRLADPVTAGAGHRARCRNARRATAAAARPAPAPAAASRPGWR